MGLFDFLRRKLERSAIYSGGSGETPDTAIVINLSNSFEGVPAEYAYVQRVCGRKDLDWTLEKQMNKSLNGREYDVLKIKMKDGGTREFWFDITSFFGKHQKPRREDSIESVPMQKKFKKGDFIGQEYEVYDVLGEGGFGIVYLVYSHELEQVYALKTFRDEYLEDIKTRERFRREAQVWIDLGATSLSCQSYFVDEISGRLYIAMEHIAADEPGMNTLEGYLRRRPPDLAQSLQVGDTVLSRHGVCLLKRSQGPPGHQTFQYND